MDTPITRAEHEEFRRRMEEEHQRVNKRLEMLEDGMDKLNRMNTSIEKLAVNMESMLKEQVQQGKRLETLETRDGDKWQTAWKAALTAAIGAAVGYIIRVVGIGA